MAVEIALTPDSRWVGTATEVVAAAAAAGFAAVGAWPDQVDAANCTADSYAASPADRRVVVPGVDRPAVHLHRPPRAA